MSHTVKWNSLLIPVAVTLVLIFCLHTSRQSAVAQIGTQVTPSVASLTDTFTGPSPLPRGCPGFTPPGEPVPVCCISGYVVWNGQVIDGASVVLESQSGTQTIETNGINGNLPHYYSKLSFDPLLVEAGERITITASYKGLTQTRTHIVHQGSQQVDIVLPHSAHSDFQLLNDSGWTQLEAGTLLGPTEIAVDANGYQYILDSENARVQIFNPAGFDIGTIGELGTEPWQFIKPLGLALAGGKLYIADTGNHRIQVFDVSDLTNVQYVTQWGGQGKADGQFNYPMGIAVEANTLYIADTGNNRIQKFLMNGDQVTHLASWGTFGEATDPPPGTPLYFDRPTDIAYFGSNLFVGDSNNNRILKINAVTGLLSATWDNSGGNRDFDAPERVAVGTLGIYVTDHWHTRVHKLVSDGTVAWSQSSEGNSDKEFQFYRSYLGGHYLNHHGVGLDTNSVLYVMESGLGQVQKFSAISGNYLETQSYLALPIGAKKVRNSSRLVIPTAGSSYILDAIADRVYGFTRSPTGTVTLEQEWQLPGDPNPADYTDIAVDRENFIYVVNQAQDIVQRFLPSGGSPQATWGGFSGPTGITANRDGSIIYVADTGNQRVQQWNTVTEGWNPFAPAFAFWGPLAITNSKRDGAIYVLDKELSTAPEQLPQYRVLQFSSSGSLQNQWGSPLSILPQPMNPDSLPLFGVDAIGQIYIGITHFDDDGLAATTIYQFDDTGSLVSQWTTHTLATSFEIVGDQHQLIQGTEYGSLRTFALPSYDRPLVTIVHQSHPEQVAQNETLRVEALGQDGDDQAGGITTRYRWTLNGNLLTGEQAAEIEIAAGSLDVGVHTLAVEFRDDENEWSLPVETTFTVTESDIPDDGWTMLLFLNADQQDDGNLKSKFEQTLNRLTAMAAEGMLSVNVAAQLDGPGSNDSRRILISKEGVVSSQAIPEAAMDQPSTLTEFVRWGQTAFGNTYYYLAIADHGQGVLGISWDDTSDGTDDNVKNDSAYLTVLEIEEALGDPEIQKVHILHLDACSMNLLDSAYQFRHIADILISSQYLAWSYFGYNSYAEQILPTHSPQQVADIVAEDYAAAMDGYNVAYTISALDLSTTAAVLSKLDALAANLNSRRAELRETIDGLREQVQTFTDYDTPEDFTNDIHDIYIDLQHWAELIRDNIANVPEAQELIAALHASPSPFILASHAHSTASTQLEHAYGISVIYPYERNSAAINAYLSLSTFQAGLDADEWVNFLSNLLQLSEPGTEPTIDIVKQPPRELPEAPSLPGDCNGDTRIDAGDLAAGVLEIFDGDGLAVANVAGGTYQGNADCDANQDTNVDAGDLACIILKIFNDLPCTTSEANGMNHVALTLHAPTLEAHSRTVRVPLGITTGGTAVTAATFGLRFEPDLLMFDQTDADGDRIPDAINFAQPLVGQQAIVQLDAVAGELYIFLATVTREATSFADGPLVTVSFVANTEALHGDGGDTNAAGTDFPGAVTFSNTVPASVGSVTGQSIPLRTETADVTRRIFLPMIRNQ